MDYFKHVYYNCDGLTFENSIINSTDYYSSNIDQHGGKRPVSRILEIPDNDTTIKTIPNGGFPPIFFENKIKKIDIKDKLERDNTLVDIKTILSKQPDIKPFFDI